MIRNETGRSIPLRWLLPAIGAVAVVALTALFAFRALHVELRELERKSEKQLLDDLDELQASAKGHAGRGEWEDVQRLLDARAIDGSLRRLALVDDQRGITASLWRVDVGAPWQSWRAEIEAATRVDVEALMARAAEPGAGLVVLSPSGNHVVGVFPIALGVQPRAPRAERIGFLCGWADLRASRAAVLAKIRASAAQVAGLLALGVLLISGIMELAVFRRLAQLADAAGRIAAGDRAAALPGSGGGVREIVGLSSALQRMLEDVLASERSSRDNERLLRATIDATPAVISVVDERGVLLLANRGLAKILHQRLESLVGRRTDDLLPREAAEIVRQRHVRALASGETLASDGLKLGDRHFLIHTMPVDIGDRRCLLDVAIDLTERVKLEEELRQSQRMETVGRLASGVAHDFNNLLTIVLSNAADLAQSLPPGEAHDIAREIEQAGERAALLTQRLLSFTRVSVEDAAVTDVGERVREFSPLLKSLVGQDVRIVTLVAPGPWPVALGPVRLEQLLLNLASNARDSMPKGGHLTLRVGPGDDAGAPRWVKIEVSDTGTGMTAEVRSRATEPFFTTKPVGRGTGLGLSICREVVEQAGGRLTIDSVLGQGTQVRIQLPLAPGRWIAPVRGEEELAARGGSETILVLEDDPDILHLIERTLRVRGYQVLAARSADEALQRARLSPQEIALLIADVVLPGQSGPEFAAELRRDRPALRLLLASGYGEEAQLVSAPDTPLLTKPFTPDALARAVRAVLDAPPG